MITIENPEQTEEMIADTGSAETIPPEEEQLQSEQTSIRMRLLQVAWKLKYLASLHKKIVLLAVLLVFLFLVLELVSRHMRRAKQKNSRDNGAADENFSENLIDIRTAAARTEKPLLRPEPPVTLPDITG